MATEDPRLDVGRTASLHGVAAGLRFPRPVAFWSGTLCLVVGVLCHLPGYAAAADHGFRLAGMPMSGLMHLGMLLIPAGLLLALWGLLPPQALRRRPRATEVSGQFRALDHAPFTRAHVALVVTAWICLVVDVMKPATLSFVLPGMRAEYGLSIAQVTWLPFLALTGTVVGSLLWGVLADAMGRRATILLASLMFIGTAICGAMPEFAHNLLMCFLMGMSAGGMLPIIYALIAETIPVRSRGTLMVLLGGLGTVAGYLAASGAAMLLEPHFGWRMLWLLGLPTGGLVILLNRYLPESPRWLLERGRADEARATMARYGVRSEGGAALAPTPAVALLASAAAPSRRSGSPRDLFRSPLLSHSLVVGLYGLGWGLVNWGFVTYLPTILGESGIDTSEASALLFSGAALALPATVVVAGLYGRWSSRRAMVFCALAMVAALLSFASLGAEPPDPALLTGLVVLLLASSSGAIAMLSPYTAEVYPTRLRGTGSGWAAGASKFGGILGPPLMAGVLALAPGFAAAATAAAIPMLVAGLVLGARGVETRGRALEEIAPQPD